MKTNIIAGAAIAIAGMLVCGTASSEEVVRYVAMTGSDEANGLTESTAFATIGKAVEDLELEGTLGAGDVGRINVAAGDYPVTAQISLTNKAIKVVGATGDPKDVLVWRQANNVRVFEINNADAGLYGLTVSNGYTRASWVHGSNVYIGSAGGRVDNCRIVNGEGSGWGSSGGNVYMQAGVVTRSVISGGICHTSQATGSNITLLGGLVESCLITGGSCAGSIVAGAVSLQGGAEARNCTICGNSSMSGGGITFDGNQNTAKAVNCIIYGNIARAPSFADGHVYSDAAFAARFENCLADSVSPINETCLNARFGFVDPYNGNYHLKASSAAVEAGKACEFAVGTDLDGNDRTGGTLPDVGCYECVSEDFAVSFVAQGTRGVGFADMTFTATPANQAGDVSYWWNFGDGSELLFADTPTVSHRYESAGSYTVSLEARDGNYVEAREVQRDVVTVMQAEIYVKADSANPQPPYSSPETAATRIEDALSVALDGCVILVCPGEYQLSGTVNLGGVLRIAGLTGNPADVTIKGSGRGFLLNNAAARIDGVTIRDCSAGQTPGVGVYIDANGGTVSNCVIRSCVSDNFYASAAAAYLKAGLLTHTEITDCRITRPNGTDNNKSIAVTLEAGATMDNCLVRDLSQDATLVGNVVYSSGTVRNCTIVRSEIRGDQFAIKAAGGSVVNTVCAGIYSTSVEDEVVVTNAVGVSGGQYFSYSACDVAIEGGTNCGTGTASSFFKDYAGGDFVPAASSPLVNGGLKDGSYPATDLAGNKRVQGLKIDIGCYESAPRSFIISIR